MTRLKAVVDAQEKANLSKVNQVVFRYLYSANYGYTSIVIWKQRVQRCDVVKDIIIMSDITDITQ